MLVAATALRAAGPSLYGRLSEGMADSLRSLPGAELTVASAGALLQHWLWLLLGAVAPLLASILATGVVVGLLQGQLTFTTKPLVPDFTRINPASGFQRLFSLRSLIEQVKALLKLAAIGFIGYQAVAGLIPQVPDLMGQNVALGVATVSDRVVGALQQIGFGLLALGVLDYGYQYWEFNKSLRMSKQEIKQENKQQEGNPELKARQRQKAQQLARRRRALKDVPLADVVITNPTHYAIALRYAPGDAAPKVLAKGTDLLAQQIKEMARKHAVPTVENRPLARSLYASVEVGQSVPGELYQAVAEVLAFVYSLRRQQRPHRTT